MNVLVLLLSALASLLFAFAETNQSPVNTPSTAMDMAQKATQDGIEVFRRTYGLTKDQTVISCKNLQEQIMNLAGEYNLVQGQGVVASPDGRTEYYIVSPDCQVSVREITGVLSPATDLTLPTTITSVGPGKQPFRSVSNLGLFKVLFQILMYIAGVYWIFRVAKSFIAGDFSEAFISFLQGFVLVGLMYVLYRWM